MTLPALPPTFTATRDALHRVAEQVLAPARVAATGNEIALEPTSGGFGTPRFPDGGRVRVELTELVVDEAGGGVCRAPLRSLPQAAELAGLPADGLDPAPLELDPAAAAALAGFYAYADALLGALRAEALDCADASPLRLWPEHFDLAFEQGEEHDGRRAGYGASPGDEHHPAPYLYVAPWSDPPRGPGWTATGFKGAELGYEQLRAAADPHAAGLAFLRGRRSALLDPPSRASA